MTWDAKTSWNVCKTRTCRGPVERFDGSVDFFDGSEAHCIECDREYTVYIAGDDTTPWLSPVRVPPLTPAMREALVEAVGPRRGLILADPRTVRALEERRFAQKTPQQNLECRRDQSFLTDAGRAAVVTRRSA